MLIKIPDDVVYILNQLKENGYDAYVVGGCVRDSLLCKKPKDWDITTNALPHEIKRVFKKTIDTGIQHGTVTVVIQGKGYEVTTYRIDGEYLDNRRPNQVTFTNLLEDDLARRDFTINAIAYNHDKGLRDPFNGRKDLSKQIVSCVGIANERFDEDALRMLRAIRFSAELKFEIEQETRQGIINNSKKIQKVSIERIREEINKILVSDEPDKMRLLYELKLLEYIIPSMKACFETEQNHSYHVYNVGEHIINTLKYVEPVLHLRLAMLFHDIGKPISKTTDAENKDHFYGHADESSKLARDILKRMKYDNQTIDKIETLVLYHDIQLMVSKKWVKKWLNKIGIEVFKDLIKVKEADIRAQRDVYYEKRHNQLVEIQILLQEILEDKECFQRNQLAINGKDIIELGICEGIQIGCILDQLVEAVIDDPKLNNRVDLLYLVDKESISLK